MDDSNETVGRFTVLEFQIKQLQDQVALLTNRVEELEMENEGEQQNAVYRGSDEGTTDSILPERKEIPTAVEVADVNAQSQFTFMLLL